MKVFLKKNWYWLLLSLLLPIAINYFLLIPAILPIVGDNTIWLMFWGSYLGGLIPSISAFGILYIQRQDSERQNNETRRVNAEENEKNRIANEQANEKNRKLQIRVLEYQQQMQWLNLFRQASAQYIQIYNTNDLIAIANVLVLNLNDAHNMLKSLFDRAIIYDTQFAYLRKADNNTEVLMNKISPKYEQYNNVLQDIQYMITFKKRFPGASFTNFVAQMSTMNLSQTMKDKIMKASTQQPSNVIQPFVDVVLARIYDIKDDMKDIQDLLYDYIHSEQARIDKILEE